MSRSLIISLAFFVYHESISQTIKIIHPERIKGKFFESTNLDSNHYVLFFTGDCNRVPLPPPPPGHPNTKPKDTSICNFYTDDQELIRAFAKIQTRGRGDILGCGYHFNIHLTQNKNTVHQSMLNTECNQLEITGHCYTIDLERFNSLIKKTKPIHSVNFNFKEKNKAVSSLNAILQDTSYLTASFMIPKWYYYDGEFSFNFKYLDTITPLEYQQKKFEDEFMQLNPHVKSKPKARQQWTGYWSVEVLLTDEEYDKVVKTAEHKWERLGKYGYSFAVYKKGKGW